jgi:hypothetical protein
MKILILAVLLGFTTGVGSAQSVEVTLSNAGGRPGKVVAVPIRFASLDNLPVAQIGLTVKVSVSATALPSDANLNHIPSGQLGILIFRLDSDDEDTDGTAINLYVSVEATQVGSNVPLPRQAVRTADAVVYELNAMGGLTGYFGVAPPE